MTVAHEKLYAIRAMTRVSVFGIWEHKVLKQYCCIPNRIHYEPQMHCDINEVYITQKPGRAAMQYLDFTDLVIARRAFLEQFGDEVSRCLKLGDVYNQYGQRQDDVVFVISEKRVPYRGTAETRVRSYCIKCRLPLYIEYGEPVYILAESVRPDRKMYMVWDYPDLLVTPDLLARVDRRKWKGIYIFEVPVREKAEDGLDLPYHV